MSRVLPEGRDGEVALDASVIEVYLFHAARPAAVRQILEHGFVSRLAA